MNSKNFTQKYRNANVATKSPTQQLIALLETVMRDLQDAAFSIERGDIESRFQATEHAKAILYGLCAHIHNGNDDAKNFEDIYLTLMNGLFQINMKNDPLICHQMIGYIRTLIQTIQQSPPSQ